MKLRKIGAIIICAAVLGLTACGGTTAATSEETSTETATETSTETAETTEETSADTTIEATVTGETPVIRVATLKGPTGMGMAKLMDDNANGTASNKYEFTVAGAPDEVTAAVISGELDIAAVPTNLASVLYKKTEGEVQIAALNTLGVLYMLENGNTINSVEDLRGKTIYATGQASTPEYVLNYILTKNGIDPAKDVTIVYLAEHSELATQMTSGDVVLGMLPVPNVTSVLMANSDVRIALNLTEEWNKCTDNGSVLSMGCVIVNKAFAEANKDAVNAFLDEYKASVEYANNNNEDASVLMETYGIIPKAAVALKALPDANICFIDGEDMKNQILPFYQVLFDANPSSIGGSIPDDSFFYER